MPIASPFHSRTAKLCSSNSWKDWAGVHAVRSYRTSHEPEYFALRNSAGIIDVSPLFKYDFQGPDAARVLSRIMTRDIEQLKLGRVAYVCWCDDHGKVLDDGTVARLDDDFYRVTAAEPSLSWFHRLSRGSHVSITDTTTAVAALSLQGPTSRAILLELAPREVEGLKYFGITTASLQGHDVWISRTGYTGDLGFEIWTENHQAEAIYDLLLESGRPYGLLPVGLDAMDVSRIEAGYIMNGVDYNSANHCLTEERKVSPFELDLGWSVNLDREPFAGQAALQRAIASGPSRKLVGLDIDWDELELVFDHYGLPPELPTAAWRDGKPVYELNGEWIGQATSGVWSPILKKNLALAQIKAEFANLGTRVKFEITAEYRRHSVSATVVSRPFFNPARKRS